jgi:hypothetical protein
MGLPVAILLFVAFCLAVMPWRCTDPRHEFIFDQLRMLSDAERGSASDTTAPAEESSEHRTAVGHDHGTGSSHV